MFMRILPVELAPTNPMFDCWLGPAEYEAGLSVTFDTITNPESSAVLVIRSLFALVYVLVPPEAAAGATPL